MSRKQMRSRREFLQRTVGVSSAAAIAAQVIAGTAYGAAAGLPTRVLGRTGVRISILGLGGYHIRVIKDDQEAIRVMHAAIDEGLTFFDNAWEYHDGLAEELVGKGLAMDGRRDKVFLMTKDCERDYQGSMKNLEGSLRRLRTDHLDLWQFHEVNYDNDPDWVFERGGLRAALEARRQGKVRFIGFTGHKDPRIHLKMLGKPHNWDTAQMPINVMDAHYRSFQNEVIPVCLEKNVGVVGMKGLCSGAPLGQTMRGAPLRAAECIAYCLSLPVSTQVVGLTSMDELKQAIAVAREFKPMNEADKKALQDRVRDVAGDGRFERFKSAQDFDSNHHRRQHGFGD